MIPRPKAICVEHLHAAADQPRYLQCVAIPGRQPGLSIDVAGQVRWRVGEVSCCELWVSGDDRLIAYRPKGAEPFEVLRAGRSLLAPEGKPIVLLDQDELRIGESQLRVHIHGEAVDVRPPNALLGARRLTALAAAAVAIGAAGCDKPAANPTDTDARVEVREAPPAVAIPEPVKDAGAKPLDGGAAVDSGRK